MKKLDIVRLKGYLFRIMVFISAILLNVIFIQNSFAAIYKYVDKNGAVCFTDSIQGVPEEYRGKAIIISGQSGKGNREPSEIQPVENKETDSAGDSTTEKKEETAKIKEKIMEAVKGFISSRLFKLFAGIIGFIFLFVIIGKVSSSLGYSKIGSILRIALTLFVLLYVFNSHLKEVVNAFSTLKEEVLGVKKQAEERNEKVNETINELSQEPSTTNK